MTNRALANKVLRAFKRSPPHYLKLARWGIVAVFRAGRRFEVRRYAWSDRSRSRLVGREDLAAPAELAAAIAIARKIGAPATRRNPSPAPIHQAAIAGRTAWTGHAPTVALTGCDPAVLAAPEGVLVDLGELMAVEYREQKDPDGPHAGVYRHELGEEGGERPRLVADGYGRLRVLGGDYTIEEDGIHD